MFQQVTEGIPLKRLENRRFKKAQVHVATSDQHSLWVKQVDNVRNR